MPGDHPDDNDPRAPSDEATSDPSETRTRDPEHAPRSDDFHWTTVEDRPLQRHQPTHHDDRDEFEPERSPPDQTSSPYGREPPVLIESPYRDADDEGAGRLDLSNGVVMAILAHMSVMFGLPFFLIPLWQRSDELSLHHARTAGAIYVYFYALLALSPVSCGILFPLAMLGYMPALVAIYRAVQGRAAGKWGFGHLGEWLFGWIQIDN